MAFSGWFLLRLFCIVGVVCNTKAYNDIEIRCEKGHRVASFTREGGGPNVKVTRLKIECAPLLPDPDSIEDVKCQESKPISCNGKPQGCNDRNSWIGGFNQFQLDPNTTVDILVPVCCSASNVDVVTSRCSDTRINSFRSSINHVLEADNVGTLITCWTLTDTKNILLDTIIKVKQCRYKVDGRAVVAENKPAITRVSSKPEAKKTASTQLVRQAFIAATEFPNPPAATIFNKENDLKTTESSQLTQSSSENSNSNNCPPCLCQCPSIECPNNLRAIKRLVRQKRGSCVCHCLCDYKCA